MMSRFLLASLCTCLLLAGCASLIHPNTTPTIVTTATPVANNPYITLLANLSSNDLAKQSDVFYEVERNQLQAPTTLNQLRYALALGIPGHPNSDASTTKKLLEQLLANPERLSSEERSLTIVVLNLCDETLKQQAEGRRLAATLDDKTKTESNLERRMQLQADEITKLRKALDTAQQKLDAIKDLEKSISERSTSPTGTRDSGNRETTSQTQTAPTSR